MRIYIVVKKVCKKYLFKNIIEVISLIYIGKEFQSFAPVYLNIAWPILHFTSGRCSPVLSRSSLFRRVLLKVKIPNSCRGQPKLFKILKIIINLKNRLLLYRDKDTRMWLPLIQAHVAQCLEFIVSQCSSKGNELYNIQSLSHCM